MSFEMSEDGPAAIRTVLADGDPLARRTVRDALQRGGITVVAEATTGTEAVELTTFYHPDALVMDVKLPGLGGIEVTRIIHERAPETCVVLLGEESESERLARPARDSGGRHRLPLTGGRARRAPACAARGPGG